MEACLRSVDSIARFGGDEFAVLVEDVPLDGLQVLCRRLLAAIGTEVEVAGHDVLVGVSIGVALSSADDDASALLRNADMAMYRAKALGKGRHYVYEPALRAENIARLEVIEALRRDIASCLVIHYQPIVELDTHRIVGLEALVRWRRDGTLVGPDEFITIAEESGLVPDIGEKVLAQVAADAAALRQAAGRTISVSVNVSAHQLCEPELLEQVVATQLAMGELELVLEMTENVLIGDDEATTAALRALAATGVRLAIDDFGMGFSSIGYLQHLPVDILKIDRSFTADVDADPRACTLVEAMVLMGSALGLSVVAEGIERESQLQRMRGVGATLGQGFLFATPLSLRGIVELLESESRNDVIRV